MSAFKTIWLYGKLNSKEALQALEQTHSILQSFGCECFLSPDCPPIHTTLSRGTNTCDLIIVIGGDGSFLQAARHYHQLEVPLIGISTGVLGFLADISPQRLDSTLTALLQGKIATEQRSLLKITQIKETASSTFVACNEVIIHQGHFSRAIGFEVEVNGVSWLQTQADGVMVATPTGSTAYSLSTGGPILAPNAAVFLLSALYPHSLSYRPTVLSDSVTITRHLKAKSAIEPKLSIDGQQVIDLEPTDRIIIEKHPNPLLLLHPENYQFAQTLRNKLGWDYHQDKALC